MLFKYRHLKDFFSSQKPCFNNPQTDSQRSCLTEIPNIYVVILAILALVVVAVPSLLCLCFLKDSQCPCCPASSWLLAIRTE